MFFFGVGLLSLLYKFQIFFVSYLIDPPNPFHILPRKTTDMYFYARNNLFSLGTGNHLETTYGSTVHGLLNVQ